MVSQDTPQPQSQPKLTFQSMTYPILESRYGLQFAPRRSLLEIATPIAPSPSLQEAIRRGRRTFLSNERARAYYLVAPVLGELLSLREGKIITLPEADLEVPGVEGLCGNPDILITTSQTTRVVPVVAIVEAKRDDVDAGIPQCAAELYAGSLLNQGRTNLIYGCVTTGFEWRFLCLEAVPKIVTVDADIYLVNELPRLLGSLCHVVDLTLAELAAVG